MEKNFGKRQARGEGGQLRINVRGKAAGGNTPEQVVSLDKQSISTH